MNFKATLSDCFSYYLFSVIPKKKKLNTPSRQLPDILLFQTVTVYQSFKHIQSKPSIGMCNFRDIYEPVK